MATPRTNSMQGGAFALTAKTEFPGLSDKQRSWIFDKTKEEDEQLKKQKQYDLYKQVLPVTIANKKLQERIDAKQELLYATQTEKDESKKNEQKLTLKLADLADTMRADALKKGYDLTDKTDDVLVGQLVNKAPNGQQMLTDYINGVNEDILTKTGLKEAPVVEEKSGFGQTIRNIIGGVGDSATGLFQRIGNMGAERAYKQFVAGGVPEEEARKYIDGFKNYLEESKISKTSGSDTESFGYKASKNVGDIAQSATPSALVGKAQKLPLLGKIIKGAVTGLGETALYNVIADQKVNGTIPLWLGAGLGAALPAVGAGLGLAAKKIAPKLQLSGLLNPAKLDALKNQLIQEGVEGGEKLVAKNGTDIGKRMMERGFKGSKDKIIRDLGEYATKSKGIVDEILSLSETQIRSPEANKILMDLAEIVGGTPGLEAEGTAIAKMIKPTHTLTELNQVKRVMDEYYNMYKASGEISAGLKAKGLDNSRKIIKKLIEDTAMSEGLGNVKMLNNETQIAKGLEMAISKKESADAVREIVNFMAGRSPGAIAGGTLGYAQGKDRKSTIIGALAGGMLGSTKIKTNIANLLGKMSGVEKKALERFVASKGSTKLPTTVVNKLNNISQEVKAPLQESISRPVVRMKAPYNSPIEALQSPEMKAKRAEANKKLGLGKVTKTSNNLYHTTSAENIESIMKEGLVPGKKQRFEGVGSKSKLSFGANEATASYYGKNGDVMIRTKTSYKPKTLEEDLLAGGKGSYTVAEKIPVDMLEIKVGSKWIPLKDYKKGLKPKNESIPQMKATLKAPEDPLMAEARKYKSAEEFIDSLQNREDISGPTEIRKIFNEMKPLSKDFEKPSDYAKAFTEWNRTEGDGWFAQAKQIREEANKK